MNGGVANLGGTWPTWELKCPDNNRISSVRSPPSQKSGKRIREGGRGLGKFSHTQFLNSYLVPVSKPGHSVPSFSPKIRPSSNFPQVGRTCLDAVRLYLNLSYTWSRVLYPADRSGRVQGKEHSYLVPASKPGHSVPASLPGP